MMALFFRTVVIETSKGQETFVSRKPLIQGSFVTLRLRKGGIERFNQSEVKRISWRGRRRQYTQKDITQVGF